MEEWSPFTLSSRELRFLQENLRAELSDMRKYAEQARLASNPELRRLWLRFSAEERRHALAHYRILQGAAAPQAVDPWGLAWDG